MMLMVEYSVIVSTKKIKKKNHHDSKELQVQI